MWQYGWRIAMTLHIAIATLSVFHIMPKLAVRPEEAIHVDSYWPVPNIVNFDISSLSATG